MSEAGGYNCDFIDSSANFECPLCLYVTREPCLTSCCGHHFCQACITRVLTDHSPCPLCKENGFSIFFDKKQKRSILELKVNCHHRQEGCDWSGSLSQLDSHTTNDCLYVPVPCPENCGETVLRRLLDHHCKKECIKRICQCQYCHLEDTYEEIQEKHISICPNFPLDCPNNCGVSTVRSELEGHINTCPDQTVPCEMSPFGCDVRVKRKHIDLHLQEASAHHFRLMSRHALETSKTIIKMNEAMEELRMENTALRLKLGLQDLEREALEEKVDGIENGVEDMEKYMSKAGFLQICVPFSKNKGNGRWISNAVVQIYPSRVKLTVNLWFDTGKADVELTHIASDVDYALSWPRYFKTRVVMLDQDDHDLRHFEFQANLKLNKGGFNDYIHLGYRRIENPTNGAKYLNDDDLLRIQVFIEAKK